MGFEDWILKTVQGWRTFSQRAKKLLRMHSKRASPFFRLVQSRLSPHVIDQIFGKAKVPIAVFLIATIVISLFHFLTPAIYGATYTYVQTDWSGGASTGVAVHPTNQTGWTQFSTSTARIIGGGTVDLPDAVCSGGCSFTDDGTLTTTANASGGGFLNGTNSNTSATNSGASGNVSLAIASSVENHTMTTLAQTPPLPVAPTRILWNGTDDYIYALFSGQASLYRYSISANSWGTLASIPNSGSGFGPGGDMIRNNNEDFIYAASGFGAGRQFSRYSILTNTWTALAQVPVVPNVSGRMIRNGTEDYIYYYPNSSSTAFYQYSIAGNSWTALASLPGPVNLYTDHAYMTRVDGEDNIFIFDNSGSGILYKYSIANNTWSTPAILGGGVSGVGFSKTAPGNSLYSVDVHYGSGNVQMHRYSISSNTWTHLASIPGYSTLYNTTALRDGSNDSIYITPDYNTASGFRKYSISGNSWTTLSNFPAIFNPGYGGAVVFPSGSNDIYFVAGGGSSKVFWRDTIATNVYQATGNFTSATIDAGIAQLNSLSWHSSLPSGVGSTPVKFQLAANNNNSTWNYVGPDGTANTYFTTSPSSVFPASLQGNRYWRYRVFLSTANTAVTPVLNDVTLSYTTYATSATMISSVYDSGDPTNVLATLAWNQTAPSGTTIKFQLRSSATQGGVTSSSWVGPDGTPGTYFTSNAGSTPPAALSDGSGDQYFQYQAYLSTTNSAFSPTLTGVTITYVVNASPEVQNVIATPNADATISITYDVRDSDTQTGTNTPGKITPSFKYCIHNTSCQTITALDAGATAQKDVQGSSWTTYTATWTPKTDVSNFFSTSAEIQVTVDDNEAANNVANTSSADFILDTRSPVNSSVSIDASVSPAIITVTSTDDSALQFRVSTDPAALSSAAWSVYTQSTSTNLASDPATVYAQFQDIYGNTSTVITATTPQTPVSLIVQDTSNVLESPAEYRLFVAWKAVTAGNFSKYLVYRSTDQANWSLMSTITGASINYFADNSVSADTDYYYRVNTVDTNEDVSFNSSIVHGRADGTQGSGEGGGGALTPTISNVTSSEVGATFAQIVWDTDVISDSVVGYSQTSGSFDTAVTVGNMSDNAYGIGQHAIFLSDLQPDTTYYYEVSSKSVSAGITATDTNGGFGYVFHTLNGVTINHVAIPVVYNNSATITWDTNDVADSYVVYSTNPDLSSPTVVGDGAMTMNHSVGLTGLTQGTKYYFYVKSTGQSGVTSVDKNINQGAQNYYLFSTTIDLTPPTISAIVTTPFMDHAVVSWQTNELADSLLDYGTSTPYGMQTPLDTTLTIQHQVLVDALEAGTTYNFRIHSKDTNANETISANQSLTTLAQPDTSPPVISGVTTSSVALTSAIIRWTTDEESNGTVDYGLSTAYGYLAGDVHTATTTHTAILNNLSGNTTYYFRVRSQDASGNAAMDDNGMYGYRFVTVADTAPPAISNVGAISIKDTSAIIAWRTDEEATGQIDYGESVGILQSVFATSSYDTQHVTALSGLKPSTTYVFRVSSSDLSGNVVVDDADGDFYTFTTQSAPSLGSSSGGGQYTIPSIPVLSDIQVTDITQASALISWKTDKPEPSFVRYGTSTAYGMYSGSYTDSVTTHRVFLNGLAPNTLYHFVAAAIDAVGVTESSDRLFETLSLENTENSTSTSETQDASTSSTTSENDSTTSPQEALHIQSIGKALAELRTNPYLSSLPEDVFLKAVTDMAGKIIEAPSIVGPQPKVEVIGTTAVIYWTTDKESSSMVLFAKKANYRPNTEHPYDGATENLNEMTKSHMVTLSDLLPGTTYHFRVLSKGLLGPEAQSEDRTFTTASNPPLLSRVAVLNTSENAATIAWRTDVPTIGTVEYTHTGSSEKLTQGDASFLLDHVVVLKNLLPGIRYTVIIHALDDQGNQAASDPVYFVTTIDKTPPIITNVKADSTLYPGNETKVQTVISWETDEPATTQIYYQAGVDNNTAMISTSTQDMAYTTNHVTVLTGFKPGSVYTFWAGSVDASGNAASSEKYTILTPQQRETIIDIITKNFEQVFGWVNKVGQ